MPPSNVALTSAGEQVEVLAERPNDEIYEPFQEITVAAVGPTPTDADQAARSLLRNRAADLGARFVSVDDANASLAWDFSGRTIVTVRGHAWRTKDDTPRGR